MWTTPLAVDGPVAVRGPDSAVVSLASATAVINEHAIAPNHATVGIIAHLLRTIAPPRTDPPSIEGSETERGRAALCRCTRDVCSAGRRPSRSRLGDPLDPDAPELSEIKMTLISVEFPKITK